jgi:tetratricopeptide (TPR) repeat protein
MNKYLAVLIILKLSCFTAFSQYQRNLDSLHQLFLTTKNDSIKVDCLNDIGGFKVKMHDYNNALDDLLEAQSLSKKINYKDGLANALQRIGILLMNKNNYSEAMDYYKKAIAIKKELGDKKGIADCTSNMGIIYSDQGEYTKAIEHYFAAFKIREEIKDTYGTAISLISIANIYFLQNNYKAALDHYFQSLKLNGIEKYRSFIAEVKSNIGLTYFRMNNVDKGLQYFNEAMKIDEELGDKQGIAIAKSDLGNVYAARKDYKTSLELLNESRTLFAEIGDKKGLSEICFEMGCIYDSIGEHLKAMDQFKEQLVISSEINSRVNMKNAYLGLSEIYKKTNNYSEAYKYYTLYKAMEDSLRDESVSKTVAELEGKYKTEKKEKEILALKNDQALKDEENKRRNQLIFGSIIIGLAISVSIFLLYNRRQLQKKNALEKKNFELERNALASQMNPHFIFNSLGSISGFVAENEKEKAIEYLGVFSKLIRYNLEQSREQLVSVDQEARMLKVYLHLQQLRFDNKFSYEVGVGEEVDATVALPPMFVQPFVENAILHGVIPKEGKGNILVSFGLNEKEELVCRISDDGIGIEESKKRKSIFNTKPKSLAMTITEERKEIINSKNKEKIRITVDNGYNGSATGTTVKLTFPLEYV